MPAQWHDVPIGEKLFLNIKEDALTVANAAIENAFVNEADGQTRFPGLTEFSVFGEGRVYLWDWKGDMIAATDHGRIYKIDKSGNSTDVTGVPLSGGQRGVFDKTDDELLLAAGGPILRLANDSTEVLSEDAPNSTHVGYIDGYVLAIEPRSGRFFHASPGLFRSWAPLDLFTAEGKPDHLNAMMITPFREVLLCGIDSVEQFETLASGTTPFFRRWATGEGVLAPYTLVNADNGAWTINGDREWVRFSGQTSHPASDDVSMNFEQITDWQDAWAVKLHAEGQKFILLQIPYAATPYGGKGLTFLFDYRSGRWSSLYGWDNDLKIPGRWPGWSAHNMREWGGENFVGGEGRIYKLDRTNNTNDGVVQRMMGRTAHLDMWGESSIDNVQMRLLRGAVAQGVTAPKIQLRCNHDNRGFGNWITKSLGTAGERDMTIRFGAFASGHTHQFEYRVTDDCPVELASMSAQVSPMEN